MSKDLWVQETYYNATEGYTFGESGVYETWTDNRGKLYRSLQSEYGRCTGKVRTDTDGPIGWVFEGLVQYEDNTNKYKREVWVTVHTGPPTETIEYHYAKEGN